MNSIFLLLATVLQVVQPAQDVDSRRERIVETARAYATHHWLATEANVMHGEDAHGVRIDTAERRDGRGDGFVTDGSESVGVPYQWGGFASLAQFDAAVAAGRPAGHLIEDEKAPASALPVGVDCSGLVSRCWHLPLKLSTGLLPVFSRRLPSFTELEPGDVLNRSNGHVMLFVGFEDEARTRARVIEAAMPTVCEGVVDLAECGRDGFLPLRYGPLDAGWPRVEPAAAQYTAPAECGRFVEDDPRGVAKGAEVGAIPAFAGEADWGVGSFVRYRVVPRSASSVAVEWTAVVVGVEADRVSLVTTLATGGETIERQVTLPSAPSMGDVLQLALSLGGPFLLDAGECVSRPGSWECGPDANPFGTVVRGKGEMRGALDLGRSRHPIEQTFTCVRSDAVPITSLIELETLRTGESHPQRLELIAFGRARP